ncbi:MAG: UDP-N-acetylmuramate--L-alanine ligase [Arenicellales bacterium]|jgi:UDP-N-acetylmuramate--alanine ligase
MREFVKHIHFVGIGGIGMSGIAEVLLEQGFTVSGSDLVRNPIVERLEKAGAKVFIGHQAENISGAEAVVTSSAVSPDNVEIIEAYAHKIPVVQRAEMLGELMRFRRGIAIAGTHGKTTTTSLVAAVLAAAGWDPTFVVGGVVNSARSNARLGSGEYLVAEADESDASFLHLQPQLAVVTNIDADHMETYGGDFDQLRKTYLAFLHNLPFYGLAILCFDDPEVRLVSRDLARPFLSYGISEGVEFRAVNIRYHERNSYFEVEQNGASLGQFHLAMPGEHNVQNALAAIAIASNLEIDLNAVKQALADFEGIGRRFQTLGMLKIAGGEVEMIDDYAHHPRELRATLKAAHGCWPQRRIVSIFQPHRYSRTRDLFDDFAQVLAEIENLIVTEVYSAGEPAIAGADGRALCKAVRKRGNDPVFVETLDELERLLPGYLKPGDILLTLGAGDIGRFANSLCINGLTPEAAA